MSLLHLYRTPALSETKTTKLLLITREKISSEIQDIQTEYCFNIETTGPLTTEELEILHWLLTETFEPENFSNESFLNCQLSIVNCQFILEVGPRMNFTTAWSTNAVAICHACGLKKITRIERSRRYKLIIGDKKISTSQPLNFLTSKFLELIHDRMTECPYPEPLNTFETGIKPGINPGISGRPEPVYEIPLRENGISALEKVNREMGLGMDDWDLEYYYNLFVKDIGRNPTNVECFDLSQSNSEHSRHWFFKGRLIIDGKEAPSNLMDIIKQPLKTNPNNSVIAFNDNSSAIKGYDIVTIIPEYPWKPSRLQKTSLNYHIIFTAETHNFPSGVAPFPGAETGTGGRIRDVEATGRGGLVIAGTAAYCVGNLLIPGYELPWEDKSLKYPDNLASPLEIEIQASNGASDYGNKFGEPLIQGFTRSFGMRLPNGERSEWIKPIMFTGGAGQIDSKHIKKGSPEKGMFVVKIGGPAYRIGIGGGAASSMIHGENIPELDFNAVQRGDAEMEQKLNRVIRACVEMGDINPIISIHDQGAGGNCNVVKEIIYPEGAKIDVRKIQLGDKTLSVLEIWGAEYQEQNALLIKPENIEMFQKMCSREKVPCAVIGEITGSGYIVLFDKTDGSTPVNLDLEKILGDMPQKTFYLNRMPLKFKPLNLPEDITVKKALERVLRLLSVGSKRFLTNKVDRSVTGLIAQQQCTGPLQLTVSNAAVVSQSHFGLTGTAVSIGEQPIKGFLNPAAMARLSVGEAVTNIVWAKISALEDIKCSGNWMWAAKLPGEGARLYDAAAAMRDIMLELGIAVDGGKDSLSMAAQAPHSFKEDHFETVKSPGTLVISAYAPCPDITMVITPDIKRPAQSRLLYIDLGEGKNRMGGTALAHVFNQLGDKPPDADNPKLLKRTFNAIQSLISENLILSGHDRSDGGLITTLLEMAFAGNCGLEIDISRMSENNVIPVLFSEELGLVIEYLPENEQTISEMLKKEAIPFEIIGKTTKAKRIIIRSEEHENNPPSPPFSKGGGLFSPPLKKGDVGGFSGEQIILNEDMRSLRAIWEETSYQLDRLQANPECVEQERKNNFDMNAPGFSLTFTPHETPPHLLSASADRPRIAVIREEGSNSDREMTSAFYQAGFETWDVTMTDILEAKIILADFKGIAFVGGFSYADVLDSAKGWAGVIRFNKKIWSQFQDFYLRADTFSLGVCNGCQLMAFLGWIPWQGIANNLQPRFIHNISGRFESRFSTVKILPSPSIMLKGMEGSVLGIWVAHGEGRTYFPDKTILQKTEAQHLAPVRYIDDSNEITTRYPFNPNGSVAGIAALCSADGRHLAIMPHPERTFLKWQWPWMPEDWRKELKVSPWLKMFQSARQWCG